MRNSLLLAAWLGALLAPSVTADEIALAPRPGVLLLHNGELIDGEITPAGDHYDVSKAGGVIYIKRSDVALYCRDAAECYRHRRQAIDATRVQDHLELAEWCLRHNLLTEAEQEIADAREADSTHPKIGLLDARLKIAREAPPARATNAAEKPIPREQLDTLIRNLPIGSMENFTVTIQPMLLNYCTKAGCHGPQSTNALRLERIHPGKLTGRHPSQRNLMAALALVNREKPDESKLLQAPIRVHGNMKVPVFTDREQAQYKQLVQWVYLVANTHPSVARPSLEERGSPLLQNVPRKGRASAAEELPPADPNEETPRSITPEKAPGEPSAAAGDKWSDSFPDHKPGARPSHHDSSLADAPTRLTRVHGEIVMRPAGRAIGADPEFTPRDPFDPEIFNRRFFSP